MNKKYNESFDGSVNFMQKLHDGSSSSISESGDSNYVCQHNPCCFACYFSSTEQKAFEESIASMIGELKVDGISILEANSIKQGFTHIGDRFKHFLISPKFPVSVQILKIANGSELQLISIQWDAFLNQAKKYYEMNLHYTRVRGITSGSNRRLSLKGKKFGSQVRVGDNCNTTCSQFGYFSEHNSSFFTPSISCFTPSSRGPIQPRQPHGILKNVAFHETGGSFGSGYSEESQRISRRKEKGKGVKRQLTGYHPMIPGVVYEQYHAQSQEQRDTSPSVSLGEDQFVRSDDQEFQSATTEPEFLIPMNTGYSVGGSKIQQSRL